VAVGVAVLVDDSDFVNTMQPTDSKRIPDPEMSQDEMKALQRQIADAACWQDTLSVNPEMIRWEPTETTKDTTQKTIDSSTSTTDIPNQGADETQPLVAGVDQAFRTEQSEVISAIVLTRGATVVDRVVVVTDLSIPYIPGLLSFREGGPILAAFEEISQKPDITMFDGSGRMHYRQAGLATHIGVVLDIPTIGVAKSLLCGTPESDTAQRPAGWQTQINADETVEDADTETVIGHALQTRQYDSRKIINPVYVSPGHRVSATTAVKITQALCDGYKLPEPTRRADAYADEIKREYSDN
jgi:deoxyribonuclease V